jgi:hypothetical protein
VRLRRVSSHENGPDGTAFEPRQDPGEDWWALREDFGLAVHAAGGLIGSEPGKPTLYRLMVVGGDPIDCLWVPSAMADIVESELTKRGHTIEKG